MKKIRVISGALVIFALCIISFYLGNRLNSTGLNKKNEKIAEKMYYLEYGDNFSELDLQSYDGEQGSLSETSEKYQLVFYLDTRCSTCINQLVAIKHLESIFKGDLVEVKVVWSGDYKIENIEKVGLQKENNFYLKGGKINSATPTCYILDGSNKIIFETQEVSKALEKIIQSNEVNKDVVIEKCNKYFVDIFKENKPIMVSFLMDGCKDCENAEPIVQKEIIQEKYNIYDVYTEDSYGSKEVVDVGNVFLTVYGLDWYPSFLVINDIGYKIIGNTSIENLEDAILNAL